MKYDKSLFSSINSENQINELTKKLDKIHNIFYANDGLSPEQALEELVKLLFLKIYDENNKKISHKMRELSLNKFLKNLNILKKECFSHYNHFFEAQDKINLSDSTLFEAFKELSTLNLVNFPVDIKGTAFQKFLKSSARLDRGQFFTPDPVIKLCIEFLQPTGKDKIIDPACGSGGFLLSTYNYLKSNKRINHNLYGLEISKVASRLCQMRFLLETNNLNKNILNLDSLNILNKEYLFQNKFDYVITNPPFGASGKIVNQSILKNYKLGYKWNKNNQNYYKTDLNLKDQIPEILFIERCINLVKPTGKIAIVLPNGILENSTLSYLRYYILSECNIISVIKLPSETFIPSGTGVKTSVLFLQKKPSDIKKIYYASVKKLGYVTNKTAKTLYKKDQNGAYLYKDNKKIVDEDFSEITSYFLNKDMNKKNDLFYLNTENVSFKRFDYDYYKPESLELKNFLKSKNALKLSEILKIKKNKPLDIIDKNKIVEYVELSDLNYQYSEISNSTTMKVLDLPSRATYELTHGDIITAVAGNSIGTSKHVSAYVTKEFDKCICTNGLRIFEIKEKDKLLPFYLLYFLKSEIFINQIKRYRTGAAIPSISDEDLMNIYIYLPKLNEQKVISKNIEKFLNARLAFKQEMNKINLFS